MAHQPRAVAVRVVGVAVVVGALLAATAVAADEFSGDIDLYLRYAVAAGQGSWAGWHVASPYPIGSVLAMLPLRLADAAPPAMAWVWTVTLPVTLVMVLALLLARSAPAGEPTAPGSGTATSWGAVLRADRALHAAALVAAGAAALLDWWLRFEPVVALLALLGMLSARSRRPVPAGGWLAAGFWVKAWPILLVLPAARTAGRRVVVTAAAGILVVAVAAALLGGDRVWSFVSFNDDRPPQPEALATLPAMLLRAWGSTLWSVRFDADLMAFVVDGPWVATAARAVTVVGLLLVGLAGAAYLRAVRGRPRVWGDAEVRVATVLVGLLMLSSPVFSPQYLAWLVPVLAVAVLDGRLRAEAGLLVAACVLTSLIHPVNYEQLVHGDLAPVLVLVARDVVLLVLVTRAAWPLAAVRGSSSGSGSTRRRTP